MNLTKIFLPLGQAKCFLLTGFMVFAATGFLSVAATVMAQDQLYSSGMDELQRTWDAAQVYLPAGSEAEKTRMSGQDLAAVDISGLSVILYAHGCAGLDIASETAGIFLSDAGYAVIEPDSFARLNKPVSCKPEIPQGGLHRAVLKWRQEEVRYAIEKLQQLPGGAPSRIFLMGLSEGAITTATFSGVPVAGRIIEGWTCNAGWPEYNGLNSPEGEPVLSLVGDRDPWFRLLVLQGDCGEFMQGHENTTSLVYGKGTRLRWEHWLSYDKDVQKTILDFLRKYTAS